MSKKQRLPKRLISLLSLHVFCALWSSLLAWLTADRGLFPTFFYWNELLTEFSPEERLAFFSENDGMTGANYRTGIWVSWGHLFALLLIISLVAFICMVLMRKKKAGFVFMGAIVLLDLGMVSAVLGFSHWQLYGVYQWIGGCIAVLPFAAALILSCFGLKSLSGPGDQLKKEASQ